MKDVYTITGAHSAAHAMRQINPDVVPVYPISPQTPIAETFAQFVADGKVDSELIRVESEHSAMSAAVGASAAGARVMTATAANGLALMIEIVNVASGTRCPMVMNVANRAIGGPINIHCDHSDSMLARDLGWIQIYCESNQEVYDYNLIAIRLSEHSDVLLPTMVMQDGFITTHTIENVQLLDDNKVKKFVGEYKPKHPLLDVKHPVTAGSFELQYAYFETKRQEEDAIQQAKKVFPQICKELSKITGRNYGYFEEYMLDDAEVVIIVSSSTAGTAKAVVDKMREQGKKVGLLKIIMFRPFPYKEIEDAIKHVQNVAVLDRSYSFGANAPLHAEIKNALFDSAQKPSIHSYIYGLGGREIFEDDIEKIYNDLLKGDTGKETRYINCWGDEF